ncbi:MAG: DnaJ domain-containing protein [Chitinivibrionales bacterium]|nr:DnaJ domain-containing protein [Chitinivibrionales bacterium]
MAMDERNPYDILGVEPGSTDQEVRRAYLDLIRKHPPDLHPQEFALISNAYEKIKTEKNRLEYDLFSTDPGIEYPFDALIEEIKKKGRQPPGITPLTKLLRECLNKTKTK